ncbi:MAG: sigma-70 family RNA polymerase sigma factor [Planctomycetes bacterium]|nr:sigma-70 family RNA polymerase sigma factor [Planctomycetota bacterium]
MTERTDAELLAAWRAGESGAFTDLVKRYQDPLLRHARGLLGVGSPYEDVVQEVFLKLARERLELPDEGPDGQPARLSPWLHKVTRNACMDIIRSEKRRRHREEDVASREATGGGLHLVEAAETRVVVEQELSKLPVDQREVLVLRLLSERSYREIAEITGKKIGTVGWLISEGLKTLSGNLAPLLAAEPARGGRGSGIGMA